MQSASPRHANARTVSFETSAATAAASSRTMATNHADTRDIRLSCDKSVTGHRTFSAWNPRTRHLPRWVDYTAPGCRNIAALTFLPRSSSSPTPAPRQGRGPAPLTRTATVLADPTGSATGRSIRFRGRRRRGDVRRQTILLAVRHRTGRQPERRPAGSSSNADRPRRCCRVSLSLGCFRGRRRRGGGRAARYVG